MPLFEKLLIANRGEIAIRIMKTAKRLGIPTVSVYSSNDRHSDHVSYADESYPLDDPTIPSSSSLSSSSPPTVTSSSYLDLTKLLQAIQQTGADAIHPGYGFLSENPRLPSMLSSHSTTFVGPNEHAVRSTGDKLLATQIAQTAGVSIAPRYDQAVTSTQHAFDVAQMIGYPVIIKAAAGGGGKGMRIAWDADQLPTQFREAREEALVTCDGDDRMLLQRYVCPIRSRHIEIQILGDEYGNYTVFPERECSIQRRCQKIIEESPSMVISDQTRREMQNQALVLAQAVGYTSAGTVEFIADEQQNFYFLEMNARLQVEHPVTEAVTGVDLVEMMLRIAAGEELPLELRNRTVEANGWATEARVYAECPFRGFVPSTGRVTAYAEPSPSHNVRIDTGVSLGSEISRYYDPMIAKVIGVGTTRNESIVQLRNALDRYVVVGVDHNVPFLQDVLSDDKYGSGDVTTDYVTERYPNGFQGVELSERELRQVVSVVRYLDSRERRGTKEDGPSLRQSSDTVVRINGCVVVEEKEEPTYQTTLFSETPLLLEFRIDGEDICVQRLRSTAGTHSYTLGFRGAIIEAMVDTTTEHNLRQYLLPKRNSLDMSRYAVSPMPGVVASIAVSVGDVVDVGQEVVTIEAMKMHNSVRAERKAVVGEIMVAVGDEVDLDGKLVCFEEA